MRQRRGQSEEYQERYDTPEEERYARERARAYVAPSQRYRDPIFTNPYRESGTAHKQEDSLKVFERDRKPRQVAVLLGGLRFPPRWTPPAEKTLAEAPTDDGQNTNI